MSDLDLSAAIEAATRATWEQVHGAGAWSERPFPPLAQMHRDVAAAALSAAAPLIERAVRDAVALEIEAGKRDWMGAPARSVFEIAARIARGNPA